MAELKLCPFCGNCNNDKFSIQTDSYWNFDQETRTYFVACRCGTSGPNLATEEEAIAAWNKRAKEEKIKKCSLLA